MVAIRARWRLSSGALLGPRMEASAATFADSVAAGAVSAQTSLAQLATW